MKLGCYAETISIDGLVDASTLSLASRFNLSVAYAVALPHERISPDDEHWSRIRVLIDAYNGAGCRIILWPLLPKDRGYWLGERNVGEFRDRLARLLDWADSVGLRLPGIVYDVETPWQQVQAVLQSEAAPLRRIGRVLRYAASNRNPFRFASATRAIQAMVEEVRRRVDTTYTAVFPLVISDLAAGGFKLQDLLEMPIFSVDYDNYNLMMYTSYLGGLIPGGLSEGDMRRLVYEHSLALVSRFGERGQVTFGSTYEAVLPGKPLEAYRGPEDMIGHIAAAKAAGVSELWLYCLEGVLYEDPKGLRRRNARDAEKWLEVLITTDPVTPDRSPRYSRLHAVMTMLNLDPIGRLMLGRPGKGA